MEFEIKITMTEEFPQNKLNLDLLTLEQVISKSLNDKNYGDSVVKYFWGFELFRYDSGFAQFFRNNVESWKHSKKWFVTNSNFDWNEIKNLNKLDTIKLVKKELIASINRIDSMKRKPKDFDYKNFAKDVEKIMSKYIYQNENY